VGWHDDVMGMKNPKAAGLQTGLNSLLYLDDTYADNGAYVAALGSHHMATAADNKPILCPREMVLDHCELKPLPVKAGSVIISRAHHWHGVIEPQQRRRLMLQTFSGKAFYAQQEGHTQLSEEALSYIPADRHRFLTSYAEMGAAY
jgi:ectoine hydroxylase-related dioxygenase (phytanoyl-CoA dioxygenase family)